MDNLSLPFIFQKCHPLLRQTTRCHSILRIIIKFHSPLCRNTENQMSFPGLSEYGISKSSFPVLSDYGIPKVIPRFIGLRNIKCHSPVYRNTESKKIIIIIIIIRLSPVCRITEGHSSSIFLTVSPPSMSDNEASLKFSFLKKLSSPDLSDNEMSRGVIP